MTLAEVRPPLSHKDKRSSDSPNRSSATMTIFSLMVSHHRTSLSGKTLPTNIQQTNIAFPPLRCANTRRSRICAHASASLSLLAASQAVGGQGRCARSLEDFARDASQRSSSMLTKKRSYRSVCRSPLRKTSSPSSRSARFCLCFNYESAFAAAVIELPSAQPDR